MKPTYQKSQSWNYGHKIEAQVIEVFSANHSVKESSKQDNIHKDIDCFIDNVPTSIKSDRMAQKTGNLALELQCWNQYSRLWEDSWFTKDYAKQYIYVLGDRVYHIFKDDIKNYVRDFNFDRITGISKKVQSAQKEIGHAHTLNRIGLIKIEKLIQRKVMTLLGTINDGKLTVPDSENMGNYTR